MQTTKIRRRSGLSKEEKRKRLELIKERYRKLVLEPRRRIQLEIEQEFGDEDYGSRD